MAYRNSLLNRLNILHGGNILTIIIHQLCRLAKYFLLWSKLLLLKTNYNNSALGKVRTVDCCHTAVLALEGGVGVIFSKVLQY